MTSALDRAIEALGGATELPDGRYAYYDEGMGHWYIVSAEDLASYATDYLGSDDEAIVADAYSHWCAGTSAEEQERGWDPEHPVSRTMAERCVAGEAVAWLPRTIRSVWESADQTITTPYEIRVYSDGSALACHPDSGDVAYASLEELAADYQIEVG